MGNPPISSGGSEVAGILRPKRFPTMSLMSTPRVPALLLTLSFAAGPVLAQDPMEEAKDLYKTKCIACHLADGKGAMPEMNLSDDKWIHGSSVAEIVKVITDGVPGKAMLPFKAQLTEAQIEALAQYVRTFDKTLKPEKSKEKK
jgi:mono/diheme cytochrome c family protein